VVQYRLYLLNTKSKIIDAVNVECNTDEQAFATAWDLDYGGKIEIWQGKRKVGVCRAVKLSSLDDVNQQKNQLVRSGLNG
jgi:hypothetical protein